MTYKLLRVPSTSTNQVLCAFALLITPNLAFASSGPGWMWVPLLVTPIVWVLVVITLLVRIARKQYMSAVLGAALSSLPFLFWYFIGAKAVQPVVFFIQHLLETIGLYSDWNLANPIGVMFFTYVFAASWWMFRSKKIAATQEQELIVISKNDH